MIYSRQKILLLLLSKFNTLSKISLQKHLFLFLEENKKDINSIYEFIPYKYGCYSFQIDADKSNLTKKGFLLDKKDWAINLEKLEFLQYMPASVLQLINSYYNKYKNISEQDLIKKIYKDHSYYAINSKIREKYLNKKELTNLKGYLEDNTKDKIIYTIGYEGIPVENYINKLIRHKIKALVDVRYNPQSRKYGFSKSFLNYNLNELGIKYYHFPELGIIGSKRTNLDMKNVNTYKDLFIEYEKILPSKLEYIKQIINLLNKHNKIALTCFEKDVCMCHRNKIAEFITKYYNYNIIHI